MVDGGRRGEQCRAWAWPAVMAGRRTWEQRQGRAAAASGALVCEDRPSGARAQWRAETAGGERARACGRCRAGGGVRARAGPGAARASTA